jgi:hypothetical protein
MASSIVMTSPRGSDRSSDAAISRAAVTASVPGALRRVMVASVRSGPSSPAGSKIIGARFVCQTGIKGVTNDSDDLAWSLGTQHPELDVPAESGVDRSEEVAGQPLVEDHDTTCRFSRCAEIVGGE